MLEGRGVMRRCTARFAVERDNEAIVVLGVVGHTVNRMHVVLNVSMLVNFTFAKAPAVLTRG